MTQPTASLNVIAETIASLVSLLDQPQAQLEVMAEFAGATAGTTLGKVRAENQDRYLVADIVPSRPENRFRIALVADGVGSLPESSDAASLAIASVVAELVEQVESTKEPIDWHKQLATAVSKANSRVLQQLKDTGASTLSLIVYPSGKQLPTAAHVGDSKIFGISPAAKFEQLTKDQTVGAQLNELGAPSTVESGRDPRSDKALAQYMGMQETPSPQIFQIEPNWKAVMIASDGITETIQSLQPSGWNKLSNTSRDGADFIRKILFLSNWLGGHDNCTAILIPTEYQAKGAPYGTSRITASTGAKTTNITWVNRPSVVSQPQQVYTPERPKQNKKKNKRQKTTSTPKSPRDTKPKEENLEKGATSSPSITFLPGLTKDANVTASDSR